MSVNMPDYYRQRLTPREELRTRVEQFQHALKVAMLGGALITHHTGLLYLAGTIQPASLYVPAEGEPLLLVRRNEARVRLESPWPVTRLRSLRALEDALVTVGPLPEKVGLELDVMPVLTFQRYEKALPGIEWHDIGRILRAQRSIKSEWEISQIRAIQPLARAMLAAIPQLLEPGLTEIEFAARLEGFARARSHQGRSWLRAYAQEMYWGQILAGASGTVGSFFDSPNGGWGLNPAKPDGPGEAPIEPGMPVMIDYIASMNGYNLDQSRTAVIGALPAELEEAYRATVVVQNEVIAAARPGVFGNELYELALQVAEREGIADGLGGRDDNQARFVGHGVGLEIDELPLLAAGWGEPLQPGMIFALEPKYVHPTLGMVGIENCWLVTEGGVERLTPDMPVGDGIVRT
jgi:Xaa-Pro dipeptidase